MTSRNRDRNCIVHSVALEDLQMISMNSKPHSPTRSIWKVQLRDSEQNSMNLEQDTSFASNTAVVPF
jgi:hypothetical protein